MGTVPLLVLAAYYAMSAAAFVESSHAARWLWIGVACAAAAALAPIGAMAIWLWPARSSTNTET
jgi:hypothetical protein